MKAFKYLSSKVVMGSFAVVLLGGLPLAAVHAEDGAERLGALHADRGFLANNAVLRPVITASKESGQAVAKGGSENNGKFHKPRRGGVLETPWALRFCYSLYESLQLIDPQLVVPRSATVFDGLGYYRADARRRTLLFEGASPSGTSPNGKTNPPTMAPYRGCTYDFS